MWVGVAVVVVVVDVKNLTKKITHSAHTKFPLDRRRDSNYKHILIEITKLRGLLSVCVQMASRFVTIGLIQMTSPVT